MKERKSDRKQRLGLALRENLRKRKARSRALAVAGIAPSRDASLASDSSPKAAKKGR